MSRVKTILKAPEGVTESQINGTYYWPEDLLTKSGMTYAHAIQTTNQDHVAILKQHGYAILDTESIDVAMGTTGLIEVDEMGRSGLLKALQDRGQSYSQEATRDELAIIAQQWNQTRRKAAREEAVPAGVSATFDPVLHNKTQINGMTHEEAMNELLALKKEKADREAADAEATEEARVKALTASLTAPAAQEAPAPATVAAAAPVAAPAAVVGAPTPVSAIASMDFGALTYSDLKGWLVARGVDIGKGNPKRTDLEAKATAKYAEIVAAKAPQPEVV